MADELDDGDKNGQVCDNCLPSSVQITPKFTRMVKATAYCIR